MEKLSLFNPEVTFYIRTAKKLGFIEKSKKSLLNSKDLKQMVQKKTKIPTQNQILYYNGQEVKQNKTIKIVEKSIVHVIDSRNVGQSRMKISLKRLSHTSRSEDFQIDSNSSIDEFIKRDLEPFYEQPAEKLFFVYSGRQLKRQRSFTQQYVESQTQITVVHAQKDRKNKQVTVSKLSSNNSLPTKNTIQSQNALMSKNQQPFTEEKQQKNNPKLQSFTIPTNSNLSSANQHNPRQVTQIFQAESPKKKQDIIQLDINQIQHNKREKKIIKSIDQLQCGQIESDQDSDNEINPKQVNMYPQKLPEEYLMEQTRQRSNTKSDYNNNSGSSSISEPNFKKKKKVSQIDFIKSSEQKPQGQNSPKSLTLNKSPSENSPELSEKILNQNKRESDRNYVENEQSAKQKQNKYKTRDEIFENNIHTYSSVIDEPQESLKGINSQGSNLNVTSQRDEIFSLYYNRQEYEVYNSQTNYQSDDARMEVRGFMNFSSASFLEPSQVQTAQVPLSEYHELSFRQIGSSSDIRNTSELNELNKRGPQISRQDNQMYPRRQCSQQMGGDSLSLSKEQSEIKTKQEIQDNLFVEYRRGLSTKQRNDKIIIREDEVSESNLLSQTYNNQNGTDMMNSITFNLEPNPDDLIIYPRQSSVQIVNDDEMQEVQEVDQEKRDSQVETNIRDSANASQIYSNSSSQMNQKPLDENMHIESMSLIDSLDSLIKQQVQVDSNDPQDSLNEFVNDPKQNYVDPQINISSDPSNHKKNREKTAQTIVNHKILPKTTPNISQQQNSDMLAQFKAHSLNFQSSLDEENKLKVETSLKQNESNLLQQNQFGISNEKTIQSGSLKKTIVEESSIHIEKCYHDQNQAIKIVEDDSLHEKDNFSKYSDTNQVDYLHNQLQNEEMQRSAAFHEISQSINNQKIQESSNFINKFDQNEPYDVSFRKDYNKKQQIKFDENQDQSQVEKVQGSKLLYQLQLQAMNQTQQPQLLPGDYIYSTDRVQSPQEVLDSILNRFAHCFLIGD